MATETPTTRPSAALRAATILAVAVGGVRYLRELATEPWARIDTADLLGWLVATPAEDAVAALLRLAALAACWWVGGTLVLSVVTRRLGWRRAVALVDGVTPRVVRHLAERTAGGVLTVAALLGSAAPVTASELPSTRPPAVEGFLPPGAVAPTVPSPNDTSPDDTSPDDTAPGIGAPGTGGSVRVRPGDHLWGIARAEIARVHGVPAPSVATAEIEPYWREVVATNRRRLRSGDPGLIHPGETVLLPPIRP